jgi:hypothetical protein
MALSPRRSGELSIAGQKLILDYFKITLLFAQRDYSYTRYPGFPFSFPDRGSLASFPLQRKSQSESSFMAII